MTKSLDGRIALVTGGGGPAMGRAHCEVLAERGAHVIVHDARADEAAQTVAAIKAAGGNAEPLIADLTDLPATLVKVKDAESRHGKIDILVNHAGISGMSTPFEDIDEAFFDRIFAIHAKASFFVTQALVPGMKERGYGKIINTGSDFVLRGSPSAAHYTASKGAVHALTRALALELAPFGICVNTVAPTLMVSELTLASTGRAFIDDQAAQAPMGRLPVPREVAETVAFLASPESDFMTGQCLSPNGGRTIVGM